MMRELLHRRRAGCPGTLACLTFLLATVARGEEPSGFRTDRHVKWTTSRIQGTPDPPDPYRLAVAFPKLRFDSPIDLVPVPGTNRLAVVEQRKSISTFAVDRDVKRADLLLDTSKLGEVMAAAFHPRFKENGWVFFTYREDAGMRLARVRCSRSGDAPKAEPDSMEVVYQWPTGGHNGGCVRFGPDGLLYLATGDGSGHSDTNEYAQDISDPRGAILRLDVDQTNGERLYRVPPDNPFLDQDDAAAEIYAYGLRQPWKMSFDSAGRLWAGDVGQDLWEMVHLIRKGANYGWSITEGTRPFRPERRRGPTPIVPPIVEHHHTEFRSVTGGHIYDGSRLAELRGAYIYGDFDTGRIWMLRYKDEKVVEHKPLVASRSRVVGFGQDQRGEVYVVGYASGRIYRLERNKADSSDQPPFPRQLSETGLFSSTRDHRTAPGVIPYSINAPAFVDGATVERFLGLPGDARIEMDALQYPRGPHAAPGWRFPDGTVLVQTISMPHATPDGKPRRIETRVLHHQRMPGSDDQYGAQIWNGYSYLWNEQQTDAELADAAGHKLLLTVADPRTKRPQTRTWRVPSRNQCTVCHNIAAKHVIGMNTMQLNRTHSYADTEESQLAVFERLNLFAKPLSAAPDELPRMTDYRDPKKQVAKRARAYLHANCSHCHRQWGGGNSSFQLMATMPLEEMKIVGAPPAHGSFGINGAKIVAAGDPGHSAMLYRMLSIGSARMPRLGSSTVDAEGARLIHDWIAGLPASETERPSPLALPAELTEESNKERRQQVLAEWFDSTPHAMRLVRAIDAGEVRPMMREVIVEQAAASGDSIVRDLFDRYLPEKRRLKRLGEDIDSQEILAMEGNLQKGEALFFRSKSLQCKNCHQVRGQGVALGPDLSRIAAMKSRAQILDSILNPSKEVKPEYRTVLVQTNDGRSLSGIRVPNTGEDVVLKDAKNQQLRVAADEVRRIQPQAKSMMPDAQVRSLTAQQLADLLAYLASLR